MRPRAAVIGAGISGLAAAFHLQTLMPDAEITVYESAGRVGGTIWTERCDGFQVEIGPNGFLDTKPSTLSLCEKLGLTDALITASPAAKHRFLFFEHALVPLPEGLWSFIRSPLLSFRGKWAILKERFRPAMKDEREESVYDFVARRAGREAAEVFADALVTGIYAGDPHLLSMNAAFPRVVEMERQHGSIFKAMAEIAQVRRAQAAAAGRPYQPGSRLWSFAAGLRLLVETLADRLKGSILLNTRVRKVDVHHAGARPSWQVHVDGNPPRNADALVLTCPAHQQSHLLAELDSSLSQEIAAIPYSPAVVIALGYPRAGVANSLNGFGYIVPQKLRRDILGVQWCSSIFSSRAPEGLVLLRAMAGGWHRQDLVAWDDGQLFRAVEDELKQSMRIESSPAFRHLTRWDRAIPQYHLGHHGRIALIEKRAGKHPGLFVTGNAFRGVALNDCTEQAEKTAHDVAGYLGSLLHGDRVLL